MHPVLNVHLANSINANHRRSIRRQTERAVVARRRLRRS